MKIIPFFSGIFFFQLLFEEVIQEIMAKTLEIFCQTTLQHFSKKKENSETIVQFFGGK